MPSYDANRPWRHLYGAKWRCYRLRFLAKNPLCKRCHELGRVSAATVVDHIQPHKGDVLLFWSPQNHQALCQPHHDGWKQVIENSPDACGNDGYPADDSW